ncbi:MAG: hypothetical protein WHV67_09350 [Thermoanaerobaculia bacterium]
MKIISGWHLFEDDGFEAGNGCKVDLRHFLRRERFFYPCHPDR